MPRPVDREFGVCLIERGSEVGGDDVRLGRRHRGRRSQEAAELPDGRWALITVGTRRIRVDAWLADDPYPRAEVADLPDPDPDRPRSSRCSTRSSHSLRARPGQAGRAGRRRPAPATVELSDDPVLASHQIAALAPDPDHRPVRAARRSDGRHAARAAPRAASSDAVDVLDLRLAASGTPTTA